MAEDVDSLSFVEPFTPLSPSTQLLQMRPTWAPSLSLSLILLAVAVSRCHPPMTEIRNQCRHVATISIGLQFQDGHVKMMEMIGDDLLHASGRSTVISKRLASPATSATA